MPCVTEWSLILVAGELVRAVEELRQGAGAENGRRRELEAALRESAAIFKHELHAKNLELSGLQQQLGSELQLLHACPNLSRSSTFISIFETDTAWCYVCVMAA